MAKRITIICLTVITVFDIIFNSGSISVALWFFYGIYKLLTGIEIELDKENN